MIIMANILTTKGISGEDQSRAPEDGLLGAVGMASELEEVAEKTMEAYQRRADNFGREVEI